MNPRYPTDIQRVPAWIGWAGASAMAGAILWTVLPWVKTLVLGSRPYAGTYFDIGTFVGLILLLGGVVGLYRFIQGRGDLFARVGAGLNAIGIVVLAAIAGRSVLTFVRAGFTRVPATGDDLVGLGVLSVGYAVLFVGILGIGVGVWRAAEGPTLTANLCLVAGGTPFLLMVIFPALPVSARRPLVTTNLIFVPFGLAWLGLGYRLWTIGGTTNPPDL